MDAFHINKYFVKEQSKMLVALWSSLDMKDSSENQEVTNISTLLENRGLRESVGPVV